VNFTTSTELRLVAESVRAALAGWEPPREPPLGGWWDEHDAALTAALGELGWAELWSDESLTPVAVAGSIELGRALAPVSVLDAATLGGALAVDGRARHLAAHGGRAAVLADGRLVLADVQPAAREPSLDGSGTVRLPPVGGDVAPATDARLRTWGAATLGYLAGLASAALDGTVAHVRSREQFGAPLAALAAVQARLADAALAVDGLELLSWEAATRDGLPVQALAWAGRAARDVSATAVQLHGGMGFALESGVHRPFRRATSLEAWNAAACRQAVS
jgi:hypothetical protein